MKANKISLRRLASFGALLFMLVYVLVIGQSILVPLTFGALLAFMLKPLCTKFERWLKWRVLAISFTMLATFIPLVVLLYFFSSQLVTVLTDMPSIEERINAGLATLYKLAKTQLGYSKAEAEQMVTEQLPNMLSSPMSALGTGFTTSTSFFTGLFLTIIYIFLFLLYRSAFKNFILLQSSSKKREDTSELLVSIQKVVQGYLQGLVMVIAIMGVMLSLGLWGIGIAHPLFWGFLAAMLAIIPFIGTFLGGLLPFLYALATYSESWQPVAVIALFVVVQFLEGNFITPKVVGSSISINPLAAIVALLVGAEIWGVAGMILSLPMLAILNEILKQSDAWRPVSFLINDEIGQNEHLFRQKWDKERFRLSNFFKLP